MLFNEAMDLVDRLNNAAYQRLAVYAVRGYPSDPRAKTDPYVARLDVLIVRAIRRAARRFYVVDDSECGEEPVGA